MKWFKHDSTANMDAKLKRLKMQWGMEGYGLYWYCLEIIVKELSGTKYTFELEHDAEIISHDTGISVEKVNKMMASMVDLELFENTGGRITCLKLAKRLDQSMTSNPDMRKLIAKTLESNETKTFESKNTKTLESKNTKTLESNADGTKTPEAAKTLESSDSHDGVMTESCKTRLDKTRLLKHLSDKSDDYPFSDFWNLYNRKDDKAGALKVWAKLSAEDQRLAFERVASNKFQEWRRKQLRGEDDFAPQARKWLHNRRWEDETLSSQPDADRNVLEVKPCRP